MFVSENVWMVVKAAKLSVVDDDKGVKHKMAECQLVIDEIESPLARELGEDVAGHVFTDAGAVRREVETITLDPRVPAQRVTVRQTPDAPGTELHDVEILSLTFARQEDGKTGREWIKATARVRLDLAPTVHREWLAMHFGYGLHFSFAAEQLSLLDRVQARIESPTQEFVDRMSLIDGDVTVTGLVGRRVHITQDTVEPVGPTRKSRKASEATV